MKQFLMIQEAADVIKSKIEKKPTIGLILGSGLGVLAEEIENPIKISYEKIPYFPVPTVEGHTGQLVVGELMGKYVIAMQGRFHYYEGYSINEVTLPIRVMKEIGVQQIIVTNAAGGINKELKPGQLMIIRDHINLTFRNPLIGPNDDQLGVRFPDMSAAYSQHLIRIAQNVALKQNIEVTKGVYVGLLGPSYETPSEIHMLRKLGGDAVGMSTVPEVIAARHADMEVLGISCISNMAAGILKQSLSHAEVIETTEKVKTSFLRFIKGILVNI